MSLAFACAHSGGACHRRSSVIRVAVRIVARACACSSLAGARVFGRCRSCRAAQRAAAPAAWWAADTRAPLCGPFVASRPPGDRKNTTNTHLIPLGHHPVSFELRGPEFWLGYIFFRAGGQSTNETPRSPSRPSAGSAAHSSWRLRRPWAASAQPASRLERFAAPPRRKPKAGRRSHAPKRRSAPRSPALPPIHVALRPARRNLASARRRERPPSTAWAQCCLRAVIRARVTSALQSASSEWDLGFEIRVALRSGARPPRMQQEALQNTA